MLTKDIREKVDSVDFSDDVRGMVGIGTLIVFIAMVIVAAVAAGVLIQTSGELQEQARATGEETIRQVSSGVKVKAVKGWTGSDALIDNVMLAVGLRAGSQGINLKKTVVQYTSESSTMHLEHGGSYWDNRAAVSSATDYTAGDNFAVNKIVDESDTENYMLGESADVAEIWINTGAIEAAGGLDAGARASLSVMPPSGFQTYAKAIVPATLSGGEAYEL